MLYKISEYPSQSESDIHTGTILEISSNDVFSDIVYTETHTIDNLDESKRDILRFDIDIVLNPDMVYWVRAKRLFKNQPSLDHYEQASILKDYVKYFNGLIYNSDLIIEKPFVSINTEELFDNKKSTFTISTSKFISTQDGHYSTHWILLDGSGKVLFKSLNNRKDLESIVVEKTADITTKSKLIAKVIHVGPMNVESDIGSIEVDVQTYNFEIASKLSEITPGQSYHLLLNKINEKGPINVTRVEVTNDDETELIHVETVNTDSNLDIVLPSICFRNGSVTILRIHAIDTNGVNGIARYYLKTSNLTIQEVEDISYVYTGTINELIATTNNQYPAGVHSMEVPLGYIPMPRIGSDTLYKIQFDNVNETLIETNEVLDGLQLPTIGNDNIYIKYTENNLLIVDTWNMINGVKTPQMFIYRHSVNNDVYNLICQVLHPDGDKNTCTKGNFHQIEKQKFIYNPKDSNTIYILDLGETDKIFKPISVIPNTISDNITKRTYKHNVFYKLTNGKIYCAGTVEDKNGEIITSRIIAYTYDYYKLFEIEKYKNQMTETEINNYPFTSTIYINPNSFVKTDTLNRTLINGDILISKTIIDDSDKEANVVVYNNKMNRYVPSTFKYNINHIPDGSILLLNNNLILTSVINSTSSEGGKIYKNYIYK